MNDDLENTLRDSARPSRRRQRAGPSGTSMTCTPASIGATRRRSVAVIGS